MLTKEILDDRQKDIEKGRNGKGDKTWVNEFVKSQITDDDAETTEPDPAPKDSLAYMMTFDAESDEEEGSEVKQHELGQPEVETPQNLTDSTEVLVQHTSSDLIWWSILRLIVHTSRYFEPYEGSKVPTTSLGYMPKSVPALTLLWTPPDELKDLIKNKPAEFQELLRDSVSPLF
jgi:hypothetical protein